ncbi:hypothetical protein [Streptomyces sp. NPDC018045]|uniref:hypothetical protein n=1 Tax=Streptomyces sp. NPDC018045 TaxID=3365037 RepID=UPI00379F64D7
MSTPKTVYVVEHNKPEQAEDHGALRTVAPACKEPALAAFLDFPRLSSTVSTFLDIEQAGEEAGIWGGRQHYPGLTWQESDNPLLGNATGLQATTEVDGQKTVVFRVTAVEVIAGQCRAAPAPVAAAGHLKGRVGRPRRTRHRAETHSNTPCPIECAARSCVRAEERGFGRGSVTCAVR